MITLLNVTRNYGGKSVVLSDVTMTIADGAKVGILAAPGSGKSTLARLLSGVDSPDGGYIHRTGRISWPISFAGGLHAEMTVAKNVQIVADLVGMSASRMLAFCDRLGGLAPYFDQRMKTLTPANRARLAYFTCMAVDWDTYIADDALTIGDQETQAVSAALIESKLEHAGLVLLSRNIAQLKKFCQKYYVLADASLIAVPSLEVAQEIQRRVAAPGTAESIGAAQEIADD